ncbi:MAG: hypothetical protein F6J94_19770 [Moorea sp. SIO1F2]|nr:hypothetical protein [Moorena sp. SIO1F2]
MNKLLNLVLNISRFFVNLLHRLFKYTMNKLIAIAIIWALLLLPCEPSFAQETITRVDKINYCRAISPICNDKLQSDYHWWEDHGVPDQIQKNTYLSRYVEPAVSNVEHVVFIASGQRFGDIDDNLLTGQQDERKFKKRESSRNLSVSTQSLAYRLFNEGVYSANNTFAGLAFDARFNW